MLGWEVKLTIAHLISYLNERGLESGQFTLKSEYNYESMQSLAMFKRTLQ